MFKHFVAVKIGLYLGSSLTDSVVQVNVFLIFNYYFFNLNFVANFFSEGQYELPCKISSLYLKK